MGATVVTVAIYTHIYAKGREKRNKIKIPKSCFCCGRKIFTFFLLKNSYFMRLSSVGIFLSHRCCLMNIIFGKCGITSNLSQTMRVLTIAGKQIYEHTRYHQCNSRTAWVQYIRVISRIPECHRGKASIILCRKSKWHYLFLGGVYLCHFSYGLFAKCCAEIQMLEDQSNWYKLYILFVVFAF